MLTNMFVGKPPGNYDRLLDYSRAVTGTLFFVPSATFLDGVTPAMAASPNAAHNDEDKSASTAIPSAGSLGIGSLKDGSEY